MPDRSSKPKRPRDVNQLAKAIVDQATGGEPAGASAGTGGNGGVGQKDAAKAAAAMLGRLGGLKGGKARAATSARKDVPRLLKKQRQSDGLRGRRSSASIPDLSRFVAPVLLPVLPGCPQRPDSASINARFASRFFHTSFILLLSLSSTIGTISRPNSIPSQLYLVGIRGRTAQTSR
jgi:hypothetical protein